MQTNYRDVINQTNRLIFKSYFWNTRPTTQILYMANTFSVYKLFSLFSSIKCYGKNVKSNQLLLSIIDSNSISNWIVKILSRIAITKFQDSNLARNSCYSILPYQWNVLRSRSTRSSFDLAFRRFPNGQILRGRGSFPQGSWRRSGYDSASG